MNNTHQDEKKVATLSKLQLNKCITYIYVTGRNGKIGHAYIAMSLAANM